MFYNKIHFCDEFSAAIIPVFRLTWSFRNHSNMLIWCSRNFIIISNAELLNSFVKTNIFFSYKDTVWKNSIYCIWNK